MRVFKNKYMLNGYKSNDDRYNDGSSDGPKNSI